MKVAIDTNSLLSFVRYYLPFDNQSILYDFFKTRIEKGDIVIIDKILEECEYTSKGAVLDSLNYLTDKAFLKKCRLPVNTEFVLAPSPAKFLRQVDNQFINAVIRRTLTDIEYENRKDDFMNSADMKLILYCLNLKKENPL
ncbi:hypothetical protein DYBT9623_00839 [Dyadobacter sp. CECT 9623]|uniref:DUF4411 family protein n=1 Tax=Dyadobacter linearis TaxID=2823330 RepID=A0ABM8UKR7_9BACT|nr:DUF4411 family protein [Dyadobacter sp. CECT 9623]CAG5068110.1 hypothetical protein DYBT9623_00839 [Dyadobacter sp. CECT 9623]